MIIGHDAQIDAFLTAMRGSRPHHAWLFAGPEGVGKASLARQLASRVLGEAADPDLARHGHTLPPDHRIARLADARTHPDLLIIDRAPKDPKAVRDLDPREWPADLERARNITVDQVRSLTASFALKPALSDRRIVIVDSVDDLERNGANALLKALEEPPSGTIFLLVSHAPGRLLPTIRSRCRSLIFHPLGEADMRVALAGYAECDALIDAGQGAPGRALAFAGLDLRGLDEALADLVRSGDPGNQARGALAAGLSGKAAQKRYEAFLARAPAFIAAQARARSGEALEDALKVFDQARSLAESAVRQSLDPYLTVFNLGTLAASLAAKGEAAKA